MNQKEAIEALKLFNEKAEELRKRSFTKRMLRGPTGVGIILRGKGAKVRRRGPSEESIRLYVLTLRFFVQDNEICSFKKMSKVYERLPVTTDKKQRFKRARDYVNNYLDKNSHIWVGTNRHIFDTIIYGGLAHANRNKKKEYDKWMSDPKLRSFIINEFVWIILEISKAISFVKKLNEEVLEKLRSVGRPLGVVNFHSICPI